MGDTLKKVTAGQRLEMPASTFNTFIDMARDWLADQQATGGEGRVEARRTGIVLVRNDSGEDCDRFAVLGIDGIVFTPTDNEEGFKDRPALKGDTPTAPDHYGKFAILLEPVAAGQLGRALLVGVVPVQIAVTDEDHRFADISDGSRNTLASTPSGAARILYQESGTGTKWALVLVGSWGPPPAVDDYAVLSWSEADGAYVSGPVRAM